MSVQKHIHMALTLGTGPENAPIWKWKASDRVISENKFSSPMFALDGSTHYHVKRVGGLVLLKPIYTYILVVSDADNRTLQQNLDNLLSMKGERVYLCDHVHPDDGEDHTPAVEQLYLDEVGERTVFTVNLPKYYIPIRLIG